MQEIRSSLDRAERICLFGLGHLLSDCYRQLVMVLGREPDFLCDNAPGKWGKTFFGRPCISPAELQAMGKGVLVIVTIKQYEGLLEQLHGMGITETAIACYDRSYHILASIKKPPVANPALASEETDLLLSVRDKWALITGASRGIGSMIARSMAGLGCNLVVHGRALGHLTETMEACQKQGVQVTPIAADLLNPEELSGLVARVADSIPPIDILFNNAAISFPAPGGVWSAPPQNYLSSYAVNAAAPIALCQAVLPQMIHRGFGRVVNISSSIQHRPHEMPYACSKAALDKYVHDIAPMLTGTGVAMSIVDPGWIQTDMGGANAPCTLESVIPGAILGALLGPECNGRWFGAQDYAGLSLPAAARKAAFILDMTMEPA